MNWSATGRYEVRTDQNIGDRSSYRTPYLNSARAEAEAQRRAGRTGIRIWDRDQGIDVPEKNSVAKEPSLTVTQTALLRHCAIDGHSQRKDALLDLTVRGALTLGKTDDEVKGIIGAYLAENPRRFCEGGIKRFYTGTGVTPPPPPTVKMQVTVEIEVPGVPDGIGVGHPRNGFSAGSQVADRLAAALVGHKYWSDNPDSGIISARCTTRGEAVK